MRPLCLSVLISALSGASIVSCVSPGGNLGVNAGASQAPGQAEGPGSALATPKPGEVCNLYWGSYDADKDGSVTRNEFRAAKLIRSYRELFMINADGSSPVAGEGMAVVMTATATGTAGGEVVQNDSTASLPVQSGPAADPNPSGVASTTNPNANPTQAQLDAAFDKMDANRDNRLTKAEVCTAVNDPLR